VDVEQGVAALYPLQPGLVVHIEARENEEVEAGAPLLQLDDTVAQAQVREAEADVKAAEAQLAEALTLPDRQRDKVAAQRAVIEARRRELEAARARRDRAERLSRSQLASAEEARAASEAVAALEAGIQAEEAKLRILERAEPARLIERARQDVEARQARLKKALFALKHCTLWAPCKGTVLRVLVREGEALGPNPHEPAIFFCPSGPRIIRAEVEQEFAGRVAIGQRAHIQDDSTGGGSWTGRLRRISDWYAQRRSILLEPRQFNDVRTLECIVDLDPNQPPLHIGQRVRVLLEGPGLSGG
jgi:multidrug resistance efflux pump